MVHREAVSSKYSGCTSGPWDTLLGFGVVHDLEPPPCLVRTQK